MNIATFTSKRFLLVAGLLLLTLILLAAVPSLINFFDLPSYHILLLITIITYTILTVSWAMFSGPTGYTSLAPATFVGVGIYTTTLLYGLLATKTLPQLPVDALQPVINWFLIGAAAAGALVSFILALLLGLVTLRLRGIYFTIFTFGLLVFVRELTLFLEIHITGTRGRTLIMPDTGDLICSNATTYYLMLGVLVATLLTAYFIRRSKLGLAMQSIGGNEEGAAHMGVNTTRVKVLSFAISAAFMGAVGAVIAPRLIYIDPGVAFNLNYTFMPVLMALFGGMGQLYGPVIGAVIFSYIQRTLTTEFPQYYQLTFGIMLILVILYLPGGLVGLIPKLRNRLEGPISKLRKGGKAEQHANT